MIWTAVWVTRRTLEVPVLEGKRLTGPQVERSDYVEVQEGHCSAVWDRSEAMLGEQIPLLEESFKRNENIIYKL